MEKMNTPKHPGKLLLSEIEKRGMKQKELAIRTGTSDKHISTVINGTNSISPSFARKLDIALGDESGTWSRRQAEYDEYEAEIEEKNNISEEEVCVFKGMKEVVEHFLHLNIMHNHCGDIEKILQLRKVLCVNNLTFIPKITYNAAYRAQVRTSTNIDPYVLFAWQRMCEIQTENAVIDAKFDSKKVIKSIPKIKEQMFESDSKPDRMIESLKSIFSKCGVAFEVVKHFRGAPVQGFIKKTDDGRVILCLTIRGKKADKFWFSLFHEIGHLLSGDFASRFVDFDKVKADMEERADSFACDTLIDPTRYKKFIESGKYRTLKYINSFADSIGVPNWVVIGRLHNDEWLDWSRFANQAPSFEWTDDKIERW